MGVAIAGLHYTAMAGATFTATQTSRLLSRSKHNRSWRFGNGACAPYGARHRGVDLTMIAGSSRSSNCACLAPACKRSRRGAAANRPRNP